MFLTASTAEIGNAILAMLIIGIAIRIAVLIGTVALITWVVKKIWYGDQNRKYKSQNRKWRKYQKQEEAREYREQLAREANQKYYAKQRQKEWEEKQKQPKPDPSKGFENNPNWRWDENTQLWRFVGHVDYTSNKNKHEDKPYIPAGWEWDDKTKQWLSPQDIAKRDEAKAK